MRTAHLFCELGVRMEKAGIGVRTRYHLPVVQAQLADALGMTPVHMNRVIRSMREDGLMTIKGREIHVLDWAALATAAGFEEGYLELSQVARRL